MRRFMGLNQGELAKQTSSTRNQIANIEAMRVPLKIKLGLRICRVLNLNPNWLFYGSGHPSPMIEMDSLYWSALSIVTDEKLFSEAWSQFKSGNVQFLRGDTLVKYYLTNESEAAKLREVKINSIGHLSRLLKRAHILTSERGAKSKLANYLGVSRQAVSEWFSGKSYPGAEKALRLLSWVEQQELK